MNPVSCKLPTAKVGVGSMNSRGSAKSKAVTKTSISGRIDQRVEVKSPRSNFTNGMANSYGEQGFKCKVKRCRRRISLPTSERKIRAERAACAGVKRGLGQAWSSRRSCAVGVGSASKYVARSCALRWSRRPAQNPRL